MHRNKMDFRQPGPKKHLQGQSAQVIFVIIYHSDLWIMLVKEKQVCTKHNQDFFQGREQSSMYSWKALCVGSLRV